MKAIRITAEKAPTGCDPGASKFFGTPTIPLAWQEDFSDDEIFFCQIRLSDIAELDCENRLPHIGYLYVFLHTGEGKYHLSADVRYHSGEPELALEDFNGVVEGYEKYTEAYQMAFSKVDGDEICTRLFGNPSDWNYGQDPPKLLMQYDPMDNEMGFLESLDGFVYLFFGENEKDHSAITLWEEYS